MPPTYRPGAIHTVSPARAPAAAAAIVHQGVEAVTCSRARASEQPAFAPSTQSSSPPPAARAGDPSTASTAARKPIRTTTASLPLPTFLLLLTGSRCHLAHQPTENAAACVGRVRLSRRLRLRQ